MSGVLRLGNTGAGTGRSTLEASAGNDQTFTLPSAGGTLLTSNYSDPGGTITLNGADIVITNANVNINGGALVIDETTGDISVGGDLSISGDITGDLNITGNLAVDGSGSFAGGDAVFAADGALVTQTPYVIFGGTAQTSQNSFLYNAGAISLYPASTSADPAIRGFRHDDHSTETFRIAKNGSASFSSVEFTGSNGVLNDYQQGSWLGQQIYLEDPGDPANTFLINAASYNAQGYYVKVGGICHVSYRIQSALNSNISNLSSTTYDSWLVRFALPFNMSYLGTDNQGLTRKIITGTGRMGSATEVFHGQTEFGNDYAEYFGYALWGDVRAYLAANPQANYQWYLNLSYPA